MNDLDNSLSKSNKRKIETDSEDELFLAYENEKKKKISEEKESKSNEKAQKEFETNKNNDSALLEINQIEKENKKIIDIKADNISSPKLPVKIDSTMSAQKQQSMVQGKLSFKPVEAKFSNLKKEESIEFAKRETGEWLIEDYLIDLEWKSLLKDEFLKKYFVEINRFIKNGYDKNLFRPPKELVFNAFNSTKLSQIKVVIIGQDPYHDNGQAHGLAFSVPKGVTLPPSLRNIFTELKNDIPEFERDEKFGGCLQKWTEEGVFLLNTFLTVEAHKPGSHSKIGWDVFTDKVIKLISEKNTGCVFMLWGNFAQKKENFIDKNKHKVLKCAHPSPFSVTRFYGSKCFSKANEFLKSINKTPINWSLK